MARTNTDNPDLSIWMTSFKAIASSYFPLILIYCETALNYFAVAFYKEGLANFWEKFRFCIIVIDASPASSETYTFSLRCVDSLSSKGYRMDYLGLLRISWSLMTVKIGSVDLTSGIKSC
jgi:hypothetical protein